MPQPGNDFCFPLKARLQIGVCFYEVVHDFDRDGTVKREMSPEIDLGHTSLTDGFLDAYFTDCFTDPLGHGRIIQREINAL